MVPFAAVALAVTLAAVGAAVEVVVLDGWAVELAAGVVVLLELVELVVPLLTGLLDGVTDS